MITSHIRKTILAALSFQVSTALFGQGHTSVLPKDWTVKNPFENKVFIRNEGQFDGEDQLGRAILFGTENPLEHFYFSKEGMTYRFDRYEPKIKEEKEEREGGTDDKEMSHFIYVVHMKWEGADPNARIVSEEEVPDFFSYPDLNDPNHVRTFHANAYKKIIYKDLYPNVDVEYIFHPQTGIKYSLVLRPGADVSKIKIKYSASLGNAKDNKGNIHLKTVIGDIIDHAPVTYYADDKTPLISSFNLLGDEVAFQLQNYNTSRTVVIDPWSVSPALTTDNHACDVARDVIGNVFVYGGTANYQCKKFNSGGVLQWTYVNANGGSWYGDMAIDFAGNVYLSPGCCFANTVKINGTNAALIWTAPTAYYEQWRLAFDCNYTFLIIGGYLSPSSCTPTPCNIANLNANTGVLTNISNTPGSELRGLAVANNGRVYSMHVTFGATGAAATNQLTCSSSPTFTTNWSVTDGYLMHEFGGFYASPYQFHGFNSVAINGNFVYTTDGATIFKRSITTGASLASVAITGGNLMNCSGICLDGCGNVYVGTFISGVRKYDANLNFLTSAATPGAVYDVAMGINNEVLASGNGFVASLANLAPCQPVLNLTMVPTNPGCGNTTGSACVTVTGGNSPYTYFWQPGGQTTSCITGLSAGTYTVTVTDANGCNGGINTATVQILSGGGNLSVTSAQTNPACSGQCTGTATVTPSGGSGYTYSWTTTPVQTTQTATGLCAGSYTVTVNSQQGCTATLAVTVTQPPPVTASINPPINVTCNGACNGMATATGSGGTGTTYSYSWNNGQTTQTATGLCAGTYTVTVKDANNCTQTATVTITQPTPVTASINPPTNITCNGNCNGSATSVGGGGITPYTYTWNNGQTTVMATGLCAGTYTVTVKDANGCTQTASVTITQPTPVTASINPPTNVTCNGACNGTAMSVGGGGVTPYTYSWNNGQTTQTATALCAGTYTVTVKDANGCTQTASVTITQPTPVTASINPPTNVTCNGSCNGTAMGVGGGGITPYTYSWNNGQTTQTATALCAGTYTVTVKDANGCTQTASVTITQPTPVTASINPPVNITCNSLCNGSATAVGGGGVSPYTYSWSTTPVQTTITATGLCQGTYTVTVKDANSCTQTATVQISQPSGLTLTSSQTLISCNNTCDGSATVNATGGTTPYTYNWAPSGGNGATASNLCVGTYTVTVTDNNGCTQTASYNIPQPTPLGAVTVNQSNVTCNNACNGTATIAATGGTGTYSYGWAPSGGNSSTATGLCAGTYTVTVTDAHGCTLTQAYTITQPTALSATTTFINATCANNCNGTATVNATGGVTNYSYSWNTTPVQNTQTATGLCAGNYTVTVTDANNCTFTASVAITQPAPLTQSSSFTNVTCNGLCNGSAGPVNVSGGTPAYQYNWQPSGGSTNTATGLCANVYTVTITDANGCTITVAYNVTQPSVLSVNVANVNPICISQCTTVTGTGSGGTGPYSYNWLPVNQAGSSIQVCPTATTTYTVVITDANNCTSSASVQVVVNPPLAVTTTGGTICAGANTNISASGSGGSGSGYTYTWNTGQTGTPVTVNPTVTTIYTVTLTDNCGSPSVTNTVQVTVNPLPTVQFVADTLQGCAPLCVNFTNQTANSATCFWTTSAPSNSNNCNYSYCFTNPGSYNVSLTVVDNNGCQSQLTLNNYINVWPVAVADFTMSTQTVLVTDPTVCFTNASLNASSYQWFFGDSANSTSTQANPCFTYTDTGTYCVKLIAKTNNNCPDTIIYCLYVEPDFTLYVPNAFTPNGDGVNDGFFPKGTGIDPNDFEMWIFDRWGNMIWESQIWGKAWDGRANGGKDIAQIDVYVWKIVCKDVNGNKHSLIGHVSLIK